MFEIIEMETAPPALIELIKLECDGIDTIEHVVVGAYMVDMKGCVGSYYPDTKPSV